MRNIEEAITIRVCVNNDLKVVQFWLTKDEKENEEILACVKNYSDENITNKKYRKIIYTIGRENVLNLTSSLIKQNSRL